MAFNKNFYRNKNIHVVGLSGIEGAAILSLFKTWGLKNVTAHDFAEEGKLEENFNFYHHALSEETRKRLWKTISNVSKKICLKKNYLEGISKADLIFVPQSWYRYEFNHPLLDQAKKKGIPFLNMTALYLELFPGKIIGVTGSNGKTTTTNLIYEILKKAKKEVYLVGNDRKNIQVLDVIEGLSKNAWLVMEISNRQLKMDLPKKPDFAVITNIYPNHLDEHKSFKDYIKTKREIIGQKTDKVILNYDNKETKKIGKESQNSKLKTQKYNAKVKSINAQLKKEEQIIFFSRKKNVKGGIYISQKAKVKSKKCKKKGKSKKIVGHFGGMLFDICELKDVKLLGIHNLENVLAAAAVTAALGIEPKIIKRAIKHFGGIKGRMEIVSTQNGITYISDIKSTTPTATNYAVKSLDKPLTLIVGGDDKNLDYKELNASIEKQVDNLIILPGTVQKKIISKSKKVEIFKMKNLEEALALAKKITKKSGTILISPAGEGFYTRFIKGKRGIKEMITI